MKRVYFDLSGDDIYLSFKDHQKENASLKHILSIQMQNRNVNIELEEMQKEFKRNSRNLRRILKNM